MFKEIKTNPFAEAIIEEQELFGELEKDQQQLAEAEFKSELIEEKNENEKIGAAKSIDSDQLPQF